MLTFIFAARLTLCILVQVTSRGVLIYRFVKALPGSLLLAHRGRFIQTREGPWRWLHATFWTSSMAIHAQKHLPRVLYS